MGNTQAVLGAFSGTDLRHTWRIRTDPDRTADEHAVLVHSFVAQASLTLDSFDAVIIGSVVPPLTATLADFARRYLNLSATIVGPGIRSGVRLMVDNPREVGADRIANSIAAHRLYGGPAIVVDFGTATTFDVISEEGDFLGGAIAPGLEISMEALFSRAARLFRVDLSRPRSAIGKNTATNVQSGLLFGYCGLVEGLVRRIKEEIGPARVIGTGGLVDYVARETTAIDTVDRHLTLQGLRLLWEINRSDGAAA